KQLTTLLEQNQIQIDNRQPELVISVGGDGTLLSAFHRFKHLLNEVSFLGVHTGHLGFYTDWRVYELKELVECLCIHREKRTSFPLLYVRIRFR
ncbi:NAD(+)/NADH kinase, partial [Enterococcus faecalis]|uniref:NAD(+)/NADH kinase n=1 Tax=Enterococcus faecalis TaxID=1351 RepID=UPI003CC64C6E